jgi:rubrerythrin
VISLELGTFGAVLKYAMEIELKVHEFYEAASAVAKDSEMANQFQELHKRGKKRLTTLERVRRENVTEMILEPIVGLDSDEYKIETDVDETKLVGTALSVEKTLHGFYSNAATKIEFLIEASYAFELLAEANERAIESLS